MTAPLGPAALVPRVISNGQSTVSFEGLTGYANPSLGGK